MACAERHAVIPGERLLFLLSSRVSDSDEGSSAYNGNKVDSSAKAFGMTERGAFGVTLPPPSSSMGIKNNTCATRDGLLWGRCYFSMQYPTECCSFRKSFLILYCRAMFSLDRHITKVFFAVFLRKCGNFQRNKDERTALISCICMACGIFCVYALHYKCGVLHRLFVSGSPQPS